MVVTVRLQIKVARWVALVSVILGNYFCTEALVLDSQCMEWCGRSCHDLDLIDKDRCIDANRECSASQCGFGRRRGFHRGGYRGGYHGGGYRGRGSGVSCSGSQCGPVVGYIVGGVFGILLLIACIAGIVFCCVYKGRRSRTQAYQPTYTVTTIQPQPAYNDYYAATYPSSSPSPAYGAPDTAPAAAQTNNFDYVV